MPSLRDLTRPSPLIALNNLMLPKPLWHLESWLAEDRFFNSFYLLT